MTSLVLGTMRTSGHFDGLMIRDRDPCRTATVLSAVRSLGVNVIDTAPIYARGCAETDLGEALTNGDRWQVWTKVGVDITSPLPRLDYSVTGMARSLAGSCQRLRRDAVGCVFVHNPPGHMLDQLDWATIARELVGEGPAAALGVSLLGHADVHYLLTVPISWADLLPNPLTVMLEADVLFAHPDVVSALAARGFRLVVRSLFGGAGPLRGVDPQARVGVITQRLEEVAALSPWAMVIAPRTPSQVADYDQIAVRLHATATQATEQMSCPS